MGSGSRPAGADVYDARGLARHCARTHLEQAGFPTLAARRITEGMQALLLVAAGGATGAVARYLLGIQMFRALGPGWPPEPSQPTFWGVC